MDSSSFGRCIPALDDDIWIAFTARIDLQKEKKMWKSESKPGKRRGSYLGQILAPDDNESHTAHFKQMYSGRSESNSEQKCRKKAEEVDGLDDASDANRQAFNSSKPLALFPRRTSTR
jgi:hypothetical protein